MSGLASGGLLGSYALALGTLSVVCFALGIAFGRARQRGTSELAARLDLLVHGQERSERALRDEISVSRQELAGHTRHLREEVSGSLRGVGEGLEKNLERARDAIDLRLRAMQEDNEKKLDEMRATVDEKLQGTLELRLGSAFKQVSDRLEAVHKGLGEMQTLAVGVGDLKRVLTNVKTRGGFGETQLEALLEDRLAPGLYERQVPTRPGSSERVDFAVKMPGNGEVGPCWLPIDAKFPQEDYARLLEAVERGDAAAAEEACRGLEARIRLEARSLRDKYVEPPHTTDFALLYLPTEGLYAEVLRRPGLVDALRRDFKVTVVGPTTFAAVLNSLQLGFRTLAIQQRSTEVSHLLRAVKTQFGQFGELLDKVQRKLTEASSTIDDATRKTRTIQTKLGKVEALPEAEARALLPDGAE
jgi:DNA recombination protein RmuC